MKKIIIPVILFIGIGFNTNAQEKSRKELKGDKFSFRYSYARAIDAYTHAKNLSPEGQRHLAEAYHKTEKNVEAEVVYSKLLGAQQGVLPEDYYNYAMVLKSNGKNTESEKWMDKFAEAKPNDLRAKSYVANKGEMNSWLKDDGKYKIKNLDINTDAEDFGTSFYKNQIVFASSREKPKMIVRKYNWNQKPFLDMYVSDMENPSAGQAGTELKKPKIFDKGLDSKWHDGTASFNKEGTYMAFSKNNPRDKTKDKIVELQISFSNFKDGKWSKPEVFAQNNENYSVGQPCLTPDGNTMYFTSDMKGGFGGADLYRTVKNEKGEWGKAENLGNKINTEGDEMFPFFEGNDEILFFASNGHFGLGGLDIFMCATNDSKFGSVYNAGSPVNTQFDDFALIIDGKTNKGYFSSDRTGGSGDDDIYSVDILKDLNIGKKIKGIAKDKDGNFIPATFITLLDDKGNILDTVTTKDKGAFAFLVDANKNFELKGKKEKYNDGENTASTSSKEFVVTADVMLLQNNKTEPVIVTPVVEVGADLSKIVEGNPIYFDLDKFAIRPDATPELDKIVKIMNEYPEMIVELGSHTDCRETKMYNQILSNNRAKASADYIKKRITKPGRIYGKGYGKTKLVNGCACDGDVVSTCSEEEHQKNRRTEFIIIKK